MPKWRAALIGALTFSACAGVDLSAQQPGVVTGRVTDASGSQPIESADVFVVGTQLISVTDADGVYSLPQVPSGTVRDPSGAVGVSCAKPVDRRFGRSHGDRGLQPRGVGSCPRRGCRDCYWTPETP